jgi:hypothetical protein
MIAHRGASYTVYVYDPARKDKRYIGSFPRLDDARQAELDAKQTRPVPEGWTVDAWAERFLTALAHSTRKPPVRGAKAPRWPEGMRNEANARCRGFVRGVEHAEENRENGSSVSPEIRDPRCTCDHPASTHGRVEPRDGDERAAWLRLGLRVMVVCEGGRFADVNAPDWSPWDHVCGCAWEEPV